MTKTTPTRSRRPSKRRAGRAEDEQRARTLSLALNLSDDLVEAARELFGENVDYTSYSRKRAAESTSAGASSTPTDEPSPIREGLTSL